MELQLIEVSIANERFAKIDQYLHEFNHVAYWVIAEENQRMLIRILVKAGLAEETLNFLEKYSEIGECQVVLATIDAYLPSRDLIKQDKHEASQLERASRQELYSSITTSSKVSSTYLLLVLFSAAVAAGGLLNDSPAVVIGAMVIAPLLGPVIAMSFSAILGDYKLVAQAALTLLTGIGLALIVSVLTGAVFGTPLYSGEFQRRTVVNIADMVIALASGAAGALSFVNQLEGSLVGVMVAVALMPPTIAMGIGIGGGAWGVAYSSLMLVLINVTCILLAAIIVFWVSGIKPVTYQEMKRAETSRLYSLLFVGTITAILIALIILLEF